MAFALVFFAKSSPSWVGFETTSTSKNRILKQRNCCAVDIALGSPTFLHQRVPSVSSTCLHEVELQIKIIWRFLQLRICPRYSCLDTVESGDVSEGTSDIFG